jgi:hypothetical protein
MDRFWVVATGVSMGAFALVACTPPHPHHHAEAPLRTIARLDCPEDVGDLNRKSAAADGRSCQYASSDGAQVTLQLMDLAGQDPKSALAPMEAQLKTELPMRQASTSENDKVDIHLPGLHIHASGDDKDKMGGRDHGSATIETKAPGGGVSVNANDNGAEIHVSEPGAGVHLTYILASDTPGPNGYKVAGYEARGPAGGPLVVASVRSRDKDHDDLFHTLGDLLRQNVGG